MSIFSDIGKAISVVKIAIGLKKITSGGPMPKITVDTKTAWASKINWTELVKVLAVVVAMFGIDIPEEVRTQIVAAIVAIGGIVTWVIRTWFTKKVTNASAGTK